MTEERILELRIKWSNDVHKVTARMSLQHGKIEKMTFFFGR